jgi:hypothetical protein
MIRKHTLNLNHPLYVETKGLAIEGYWSWFTLWALEHKGLFDEHISYNPETDVNPEEIIEDAELEHFNGDSYDNLHEAEEVLYASTEKKMAILAQKLGYDSIVFTYNGKEEELFYIKL